MSRWERLREMWYKEAELLSSRDSQHEPEPPDARVGFGIRAYHYRYCLKRTYPKVTAQLRADGYDGYRRPSRLAYDGKRAVEKLGACPLH